jgi:hypothetical protein
LRLQVSGMQKVKIFATHEKLACGSALLAFLPHGMRQGMAAVP